MNLIDQKNNVYKHIQKEKDNKFEGKSTRAGLASNIFGK